MVLPIRMHLPHTGLKPISSARKMNLGLANKNVVVTGGTRGIGLAIAKGFLQEGSTVHVLARSPLSQEVMNISATHPGKFFFHSCDATDEYSLIATAEKIGDIDIVVANVGNGRSLQDPISPKEQWNNVWDINFNTALNSARVFSPALAASHGVLIFISSIAGSEFIGAPTDYSVAKSALASLSKNLSHRLAPNVRVNVVSPGNIYFENGTWHRKLQENPLAVKEMLDNKVPLKRFGMPEEVSDLVIFLSSERAAFITGGTYVIDGGQTISF